MMSNNAQQEMTLQQWVDRLPSFHLAHREYDALLAEQSARDERVAALEAALSSLVWLHAAYRPDTAKQFVKHQEAVTAINTLRALTSKRGV